MYKKPLIITTIERIVYEISKLYYLTDPNTITSSVDETITNKNCTFKNQISKLVNLTYDNELFILTDENLGIVRIFHLPQEYANLTRTPSLSGYLNIDPIKYNTFDKSLPKHRSVKPLTFSDLLLDIEFYFEISPQETIPKLKELADKNISVITNTIERHGLMQTRDFIKFQVDDLSYPAITVTKTSIRPRRKFSRYVLNKSLIESILSL